MKFAFIYALPGFTQKEIHVVKTVSATFYAMAVDIKNTATTVDAAIELYDKYQIDMLELCGGLANAELVAKVKIALNNKIPVGAVYYGPESRRPLVDLLEL